MDSCSSPYSPRNSSSRLAPFPPGDTHWHTKRLPSRWREFSFAFHQITTAIQPALALSDVLANWDQIAKGLAEAPRKRKSQEQIYSPKQVSAYAAQPAGLRLAPDFRQRRTVN